MSPENNLESVRSWFEDMWSTGNIDLARQLVHPDYAPEWVHMDEKGPDQILREMRYFRGVFPDLSYSIADAVAHGENKVWARVKGHGTQDKAAWGFEGSGRQAEFEAVHIFTFAENGQVIDCWSMFNMYDLFHSLGLVPPWWELSEILLK